MEEKDPSLQAPQEANTTKHINFLETEESNDGNSTGELKDDRPTKQAWEELREENKNKQQPDKD